MDEIENRPMPENVYKNRGFLSPDVEFSGRSVVFNSADMPRDNLTSSATWPQSLGEYLKDYVGRQVWVRYALPSGQCCEKRGRLEVVGTNFLGIRSCRGDNLLLVELSYIFSVNLIV
ncbi:MAG: hypothetical protein EOM14_02870 [Clostridia bacterium]|nr:hypothetical protein [Clostridia bacterium]